MQLASILSLSIMIKWYQLKIKTKKGLFMENLAIMRKTQQLNIDFDTLSYEYKLDEKAQFAYAVKYVKALLQDIDLNNAQQLGKILASLNLKQVFINNRRYLGNKYTLSNFIRTTVNEHCQNINTVADIFSGTGAVANAFKDKQLITNDLLYSNYIANYAWFAAENYSEAKIISMIYGYNRVQTEEDNYMRKNFADTFFSAADCSKIGFIREDIEQRYKSKQLNFKEYAILITALLYAMDKIANTVGHYDAYRKNVELKDKLILSVVLPEKNLNTANQCFNTDATNLVNDIKCDLLYLDPPYNSRQYCDAYHLLENVAKWQKPKVFGVARKMDRTSLKSDYCTVSATKALAQLIKHADAKYILLSYNNMSNKGNDRSNAKIADEDILQILQAKGKVTIFEEDYKSFSTGKSKIKDNKERLFLCECNSEPEHKLYIPCPFNYTGGKYKLLNQMTELFYPSKCFFDLFAGGGNVGINASADKLIFNDINQNLINLLQYLRNTDTKELLAQIDQTIAKYKLSNTSLYGYEFYNCESSKGLAKYNKAKFQQLKSDYNKLVHEGKIDYNLFYVLIVFAFNNQIRFNRKGEFNLPVGKRDFNAKMRSKLLLFSERLKQKDIQFFSTDFRNINLNDLEPDTFIYCDPPYLITTATYNEQNKWTSADEIALLNFLDEANGKNFKFALSNVLESKNQTNDILINWLNHRDYTCHHLSKSYANSNYQRKAKQSISSEVLITNYKL